MEESRFLPTINIGGWYFYVQKRGVVILNTENEIKKEYLRGYEKAIRQMKRCEERLKEIRGSRTSISVATDGMPHAHDKKDLSSYAALLDQEERKYMKVRYIRIQKCTEISNKIERLEDEDEKDVLLYRYIKLMKWEDICVEMNLSWQHVHRIHARALKNFKM